MAQWQKDLSKKGSRKTLQEKKKEVRRAGSNNAFSANSHHFNPPRQPSQYSGNCQSNPRQMRPTDATVFNAPTGPRHASSVPTGPRVRDSPNRPKASSLSISAPAKPIAQPHGPVYKENIEPFTELCIFDNLELLLHPQKAQIPSFASTKEELSPAADRPPAALFPFDFSNGIRPKDSASDDVKTKPSIKEAMDNSHPPSSNAFGFRQAVEAKPTTSTSYKPQQSSEALQLKEKALQSSLSKPFLLSPPLSTSLPPIGSNEESIPELRRQVTMWHEAWEKENKENKELVQLRISKNRELKALNELLDTAQEMQDKELERLRTSKDREIKALNELLVATQEKNKVLESRNMAALNALGFQI